MKVVFRRLSFWPLDLVFAIQRRGSETRTKCCVMGAICSKSSDTTGGHVVLGSSADGATASNPNPRAAAAEAAEARAKAVSLAPFL